MPLQSIETRRLYQQIAQQLQQLILAGEFAPGSRLPAERELATQLGVSRPSVREALIALEVEGWVEVRTGSGVYVLERSARTGERLPVNAWGPLEVIRARRVIEGEIAALALVTAKPAPLFRDLKIGDGLRLRIGRADRRIGRLADRQVGGDVGEEDRDRGFRRRRPPRRRHRREALQRAPREAPERVRLARRRRRPGLLRQH